MANFNKVILAGNLTRDPQLSYLPNQTPAVEFGMAINRRWRDQQGQQKEEVCFVDLRAYGRQAETINQYMRKGRSLMVEGRLNFSSWEGKDGSKHSKLRVIVENFQFLDSGQGRGEAGTPPPARGPAQRPAPAAPPPSAPAMHDEPGEPMPPEYDQPPPAEDNIPF